ncbi:hypothetical protein O7631_10805 [Micromonospora sp. WMMD967]|uniref:hypothetical protein n=1 Tax=Micromonospora sp. WMMD967 TaxID=3016101 RepID=UPI0024162A65|nr:hypothetical protein [Micromonospora sp. WMMD967]MDG4837006.1 hypothetical protein [Micromonospora sp. WMMD967]
MSVSEVAARLPGIEIVHTRSVALATLDAILSADWESRRYSFDVEWGPQEQLGSMRNGSGDECSVVFFQEGAFIRGFDHESEMSPLKRDPASLWPGLVDGIPPPFMEFVDEPAFSGKDDAPLMTVCLWRSHQDKEWSFGDLQYPTEGGAADGSDWLLGHLVDWSPQIYLESAVQYFEVELELADVAAVYQGDPLDRQRVHRMNPERDWDELVAEVATFSYPVDVN